MNDNFNIRMILTTTAFAAVAALLVGPASARVMDIEGGGVDESQSSGQSSVELSGDTALRVDRAVAAANEAYEAIVAEASARQAAQSPAASPSWRGKGGKGEETGGATNPLQRTVATAPAFPSGDELDTAISTAIATRAARELGTLSGEQQTLQASRRIAANDAAHFPDRSQPQLQLHTTQDTSDVVSRYLGNDRALYEVNSLTPDQLRSIRWYWVPSGS